MTTSYIFYFNDGVNGVSDGTTIELPTFEYYNNSDNSATVEYTWYRITSADPFHQVPISDETSNSFTATEKYQHGIFAVVAADNSKYITRIR